ncbi:MAG TPA: ABC transporter substrate-binding protein [Fermentimonas caenicola]|jgi:iron complex transport system substrate-binding protein|uniref:ABC transporter substrate-binding protein n=1 Tax=Lascolabacillus sp. TaxID=1924068 RepID=UPI0017EC6A6D|nr:ABC transporter substrate-binding protein [Lascolabacillus sp.]MDD3658879.1 ABC transporter substrate-binding protein [Lascolabacillus sp.]MDI9626569.1 ABC transporter substrate-binding protein [Bacteroidota bacterium]HHU41931.1 ABC transporter substrate-binding protein [Fermentimonas caenicola]
MKFKVNNSTCFSIFYVCLVIIFNGCNTGNYQKNTSIEKGKYLFSEDIRYAQGFKIDYYEEYTRVIINNPWQENREIYRAYYLVKTDSIEIPEEGIKVKVPLTSISVNTFSYFEFLSLLGELDKVTGVTDGSRIYNPEILNKISEGQIIDLGDPFNPNIEKTIALSPQAVINSAYAQLDNYSLRLTQAGLPIIYSLEWMENNPLARAEWIKMIAAFFEKGALADTLFNNIEERYLAVREIAYEPDTRKKVMTGDIFQGTWYVPGGDSFNAALFRDAGLKYIYENNNMSGSIGLDIESVLTQFGESDIWFGCEADRYSDLAAKDSKYMLLKPYKEKQIFNNHNRTTKTGGNDYFESSIAHPDLILSDIVKAAYPEKLHNYSFTYIRPLN